MMVHWQPRGRIRRRFFGGAWCYIEHMKENQTMLQLSDQREMMRAFHQKNPDYDGVFYVAVKSTGIFCRPSCPSQPKPENVEFFGSVRECLFAGYRACKRCRP